MSRCKNALPFRSCCLTCGIVIGECEEALGHVIRAGREQRQGAGDGRGTGRLGGRRGGLSCRRADADLREKEGQALR